MSSRYKGREQIRKLDYDLIDSIFRSLSVGDHPVHMTKLLFLYREAKKLSMNEIVEVYFQLHRDIADGKAPYYPILGDSGSFGFASEAWHQEFKAHLKRLKEKGIRWELEFMLTRKFSYFITRLHKILRSRWEKGYNPTGYVLIGRRCPTRGIE